MKVIDCGTPQPVADEAPRRSDELCVSPQKPAVKLIALIPIALALIGLIGLTCQLPWARVGQNMAKVLVCAMMSQGNDNSLGMNSSSTCA